MSKLVVASSPNQKKVDSQLFMVLFSSSFLVYFLLRLIHNQSRILKWVGGGGGDGSSSEVVGGGLMVEGGR